MVEVIIINNRNIPNNLYNINNNIKIIIHMKLIKKMLFYNLYSNDLIYII